jgi:oxygen-dependent protoporphyrinogen oxidase
MTEEPPALAARAAETRVVVIGGGIGGLIAARECAKLGMRVTVLEAADAVGGAIRRAALGDITVDAGAESFATRGGHVRALVEELGLGDRVVTPAAGGAWLAGIPGIGAAPLPVGGILGIPANPFQDDVRRIIGWSGVWRAYLDRIRPPLTI